MPFLLKVVGNLLVGASITSSYTAELLENSVPAPKEVAIPAMVDEPAAPITVETPAPNKPTLVVEGSPEAEAPVKETGACLVKLLLLDYGSSNVAVPQACEEYQDAETSSPNYSTCATA
ncbi:hypothetical protein HDV00_010824 [Rhizophlyctis rosea]|nr:hypothetical protein HDV00_010824 [Rhizophlyctis rosea]